MGDFGAVLRRLREAKGLSQRQLADLVYYTGPYISQMETGRKPPSSDAVRRLDQALDAGGALERAARRDEGLPDTGSEALRVAMEWLVGDPPHAEHLRAGRRIGHALVEELARRVHELRLLDDHLGGADTIALVTAELERSQQLAREASYTQQVGARLMCTIAELAQLAGWTASDAGDYALAERMYLDGLGAAKQAGAVAVAVGANLLSCLSYQIANVGRPSDAVLLARAAVKGAGGVQGKARALLLDRLAWAYARTGDPGECDRSLDLVDEALETPAEDEPMWVYWVDRTEADVMAGRCYVELRRPLRAVPKLTTAIGSYPTDRARETALYRTWLAEAYVHANEAEAARDTLRAAKELGEGVHSERLHSRLRDVAELIPA